MLEPPTPAFWWRDQPQQPGASAAAAAPDGPPGTRLAIGSLDFCFIRSEAWASRGVLRASPGLTGKLKAGPAWAPGPSRRPAHAGPGLPSFPALASSSRRLRGGPGPASLSAFTTGSSRGGRETAAKPSLALHPVRAPPP